MKGKFSILIIMLIVSLFELKAYTQLTVLDPQSWWTRTQGNIEEATISIRPKGLYVEYGLYLTFSAKGTYLESYKKLENVLQFDLPKDAIITDLWLWVGNDIMKADLMDKWKASSIYENIVNRRKDPALLTKVSKDFYELRVYPMDGNETRKVKITYMVPFNWGTNNISSELPVNILNSSAKPVNKLTLLYFANSESKNPRLSEYPSAKFEEKNDNSLGKHYVAQITTTNRFNQVSFELDSPMKDGIYLSKYVNPKKTYDNVYEMAFIPSKVLNIKAMKKVLYLVDFGNNLSTFNSTDLLANLKSHILNNIAEADTFNIMFSSLNIVKGSNTWLKATNENIERVFKLGATALSGYNNITQLLSEAVNFINQNGNNSVIYLISNSDNIGDYTVANPLLNDLMKLMKTTIPVHVLDIANKNPKYYYFGDRSYYGNTYFYENVTRKTNGTLTSINNYSNFKDAISQSFSKIGGFLSTFDFITNMKSGFCYSRFNINETQNALYLDKPILQVGKFYGNLPMEIKSSGVYNSLPFMFLKELTNSETSSSDSTLSSVWAGKYIQEMENRVSSSGSNNNIINEIIEYSVSTRVLSLYTAFLAVEPNDTTKPCFNCIDETNPPIATEDEETKPDYLITINSYPNPFNGETRIKISIGKDVKSEESVKIHIYNIMGQIVKTFDVLTIGDLKNKELVWDGKNDAGQMVASGTYFLVMVTPDKKYTVKLMYLK